MMRGPLKIVLAASVVIVAVGCHDGNNKGGETTASAAVNMPPPVPYVVGKADFDDDAAEPSVRLRIAVAPATAVKDIERLLNYFEKERYADYDIVWVDVYFDVGKARSPEVDPRAVVATLRVNRPGFRELKVSDDLAAPEVRPGGQPEVTSETEEVLYLGRRGRMFDSTKQAQVLLDLMAEKPGHAIYRVVWQGPMNAELSYSVEQKMLVRARTGVSRETWADISFDELARAARGAGFGGRRRHGGNYTYMRESGQETPAAPG